MSSRLRLQQATLIALAIGAVGLCIWIALPFLWPILGASALAVLFYPLYAALVRRMPRHESAAAGIALLAVVVAILLPSILLGRAISGEVSTLYAVVKDKNWSDWIPPQIPMAGDDVRAFVTERLDSISGVALRLARGVAENIAGFFVNGIFTLFILFYLLRDGDRLLDKARRYLPIEEALFDRLIAQVGRSVLANVYGIGAVALAQGSLTGLLFYFVGLHSPVLWGVVAAFCSMIPVVGPPAVWVPAAIALAMTGSWGKAAVVVVFGVTVIGLADNVIRPWIISGQVQLHPLLVFISLLGGTSAFGFLGLFAGPAILSVTIVIFEVLKHGLAQPAETGPPE
ncbi:MAG: AI-2E family transporter [Acidobacteria bacterium]|nr:AI-2E family transporter [Acidobacteriota bacterium]